jgi:hypothetical protein
MTTKRTDDCRCDKCRAACEHLVEQWRRAVNFNEEEPE